MKPRSILPLLNRSITSFPYAETMSPILWLFANGDFEIRSAHWRADAGDATIRMLLDIDVSSMCCAFTFCWRKPDRNQRGREDNGTEQTGKLFGVSKSGIGNVGRASDAS